MRIILLAFFLLLHLPSFSQKSFFNPDDRICFVGNSITHAGDFHHNILLYQITRFPNIRVDFFNNGISGDVTSGILKRMESDILIHKPTHCIIMIGMNDVRRNLYGKTPTQNTDTLELRKKALDIYKKNLDEIVNIFLSKQIKVILQKPSIYDQTAVLKTFNNLGVNDALKDCADFGESLAQKYNLKTVDYWTILRNINDQRQKENPNFTIIGNDRVHPGAVGHLVMATQFLKTIDSPKLVSSIIIGKKKNDCENCQLSDLRKQNDAISFSVLENSLPFPVIENQKKALNLVAFTDDLNQQNIQFSKISKGIYQLTIDSVIVGTFTHTSLKKGINLAQYEATPQYQQALSVRKILEKLWEKESNLRTIKWTEYSHMSEFKEVNNLDVARKYLDQRFTDRYKMLDNAGYYKSQFDKYFVVKPNEKQYLYELEELKNKVFQQAIPS
jgi:lysophospholipase L1-like esterase